MRRRAGQQAGAWLSILLAALLGSACATRSGPSREALQAPADASPELDFLVARDLEAQGHSAEALQAYKRALSKDPESVYLLKQVAELSARENRLSEALAYGERAFQLAPDDPGVRLFLGTLYRFRKDVESAQRVLLDAQSGDPMGSDAALLLFGIYSDAKRYGDARRMAEWLVKAEPDGVRGWLALAEAVEKQGDPAGGESVLRRALAQHPDELTFYAALARSRRERGDRVGEIAIYDEVLALQPDQHATLLAKAEAEVALGRDDDATRTLERVEARYPDDVRTVLRLAFLDYERGNLKAAERRFAGALARKPEQHEVAYFLGVVRRRLGNDAGALQAFEGIPKEHQRYADARTQIAGIYERQEKYAAAMQEVERARSVAPSKSLDLYAASLLAKSGDVDGALVQLKSMLKNSPDDADVLYNIGVIYGEASKVEEAIRTMQTVLGINPDHAGALNYVGYTWAEKGEHLDEAEALIAHALEIRPDDGYITDSLGWVYYMRAQPLLANGDLEGARVWLDRAAKELERAAKLTGGDPVVSEHLGDVYLSLSDKQRALEMYEAAWVNEPRTAEQPELHQKLDRLRRELQQK